MKRYETMIGKRSLDNLIILDNAFNLKEKDLSYVPYVCSCCVNSTKKTIYVNFTCNKKCYYCSTQHYDLGPTDFFIGQEKEGKIINIKKQLSGIKAVVFSGGEPTLPGNFNKLLEILDYLSSLKEKYYACLFTNGDFLDKHKLNLLKQKGLMEIKISVHDYHIDKLILSKQYFEKVFCEIPAIPGEVEKIKTLVYELNQIGMPQIIIDELQFTPANTANLKEKGFKQGTNGEVIGSFGLVLDLAQNIKYDLANFKIVFCPVSLRKHTYAHQNKIEVKK
ncbi:MAG: radical SAM protein [Candidatus Daviesbacteria bacterium]|nr:radical SAM protein [Candidatus Daviesbacteria bacterium]